MMASISNKRKRMDEHYIESELLKKRKLNHGNQLVVSIFKGVYFSRTEQKWMAVFNLEENRNIFLGYFDSQTEAAKEVAKGGVALNVDPVPNVKLLDGVDTNTIERKSIYELVELNA